MKIHQPVWVGCILEKAGKYDLMPSTNPVVMSNFLVPSDSVFLSVKLEETRQRNQAPDVICQESVIRILSRTAFRGQGSGFLVAAITTSSCWVVMHQELSCETGLKQTYQGTVLPDLINNQCLRPTAPPETLHQSWPAQTFLGAERSKQACMPGKLRSMFTKWPHLCDLMPQCHHQIVIPSFF